MYLLRFFDITLIVCIGRAMRLDDNEAQALLDEYTGPQYEIEKHMTVINS